MRREKEEKRMREMTDEEEECIYNTLFINLL